MEPGTHAHIPFATYLQWPLLSQSTLKTGRKSMAHLKAALDGIARTKATDDMILGSALHTAFLEPELMLDRVVKWTGAARRGADWTAFCIEHEGKVILTSEAHEKLMGMVRSLRAHPAVREWLGKIQDVELSGVGDINGVRMKARCDAMTPDPLVDLKKVRSGDLRMFTRTVLDFGYHMQGHIYKRIFGRDRFLLITVEDTPPYDVVPYELSPAMLRKGEEEVTALLDQYKWCKERGEWPGRSNDVIQVELPDWAVSADADNAITFDDEPAHMENTDGN